MSNKDILNFAISCGGFFLVANGVKNMVQNQDYAALQTLSGGAVLTCYYASKLRPSHVKMKKMLDDLFSEKTILTKGQLLFWDSKSKTKGFGVNKRVLWTRVEIEQDSFNRFIPPNVRLFWSQVISDAVKENLINGKSVKTALLMGLVQATEKLIPDFKKNFSVRDYVEKDRMIDLFSLKLVHEVYQKVEKCKNDEAVLDYLKTAFNEKNSLFFGCGIGSEENASSFLNREIYQTGKEKEFKVLSVFEKAAMVGSATCSVCFSTWENPLLWAGVGAGVFGVYSLGFLRRDAHLKKQFSRFETNSFVLQDVQFLKMGRVETNGYLFWYQRMKNLTKMERAKISYEVACQTNDVLNLFPKDISCKEAALKLFFEGILKNKENNQIYQKIEKGATLESAVKTFGLKAVYRLLVMHKMVEDLKSEDQRGLRSFVFEFQSSLVEFKNNMQDARCKITKRAYNQLNAIKQRYLANDLTEKEKKEAVLRVLEEEENGVFMQVPVQTKLPAVIQKVLKEEYVKN